MPSTKPTNYKVFFVQNQITRPVSRVIDGGFSLLPEKIILCHFCRKAPHSQGRTEKYSISLLLSRVNSYPKIDIDSIQVSLSLDGRGLG